MGVRIRGTLGDIDPLNKVPFKRARSRVQKGYPLRGLPNDTYLWNGRFVRGLSRRQPSKFETPGLRHSSQWAAGNGRFPSLLRFLGPSASRSLRL